MFSILKIFTLIIFFCFSRNGQAEEAAAPTDPAVAIPHYKDTPSLYEFIPNAFSDVPHFFKNADPREHWRNYLGLAALTGVLIHYDQDIIDGSQRFARHIKLINDTDKGGNSRAIMSRRIFGIDADLRVPKGTNAYFYFLGDGLVSVGIIGGLLGFGAISSDVRALNTASQLAEAIALTGMFVITGKYTAGRESPFRATKRGGAWRPMPGIKNYLKAVSKYDAFPSGHIATLTTTFTVLVKNYPEKFWLLPLGYTTGSLLMFGMLNNGVHWAGDYPLGIAIGYLAATTVFERRKPADMQSHHSPRRGETKVSLSPLLAPGRMGLVLNATI